MFIYVSLLIGAFLYILQCHCIYNNFYVTVEIGVSSNKLHLQFTFMPVTAACHNNMTFTPVRIRLFLVTGRVLVQEWRLS